MTNLLNSLKKAIGSSYTRHKGCLVERKGDRFYSLGKEHRSAAAARAYIDQVLENLSARHT